MNPDIVPFDLHRMFIGEVPPLFLAEIVVRTLIIYAYALSIIRILSKRGMPELTPLEYLLIVAMGSAAGDPMFHTDVPLLYGMIVLTLLIVMRRGIIYITQRVEPLEHLVEAPPVMIVDHGRILRDVLRHEEIEMGSLLAELRHNGVRHLSEVEFAYLEPDGKVSVFRYDDPPELAETIIPHHDDYCGEQTA
ncbi:MAG: DUF421 domain-containing protein [candidate division WS1 bacterium]|jgi:uncharacterized membrane protein YcaP (DUF421 family)|nr:DUF421 domain-containing protein [candidate division WS1 bacterium]